MRSSLRGLLLLVLAATVAVSSASPASAFETPAPQPSSNRWLAVVNYYRATAYLPRVSEDDALSRGARKHAEYMVRNDYIGHSEDPRNPFFTNAGNEAGMSSNVAGWWGSEVTNRDFVEMWMVGPFHAVGILRPHLKRVGFGVAHDNTGMTSAAALDVIHGLRYTDRSDKPVVWPGHGTTQPLSRYTGGEYPNPLSSCRGYAAPSGVPIIVQFPTAVRRPSVSFTAAGGESLPACAVDATSYQNPDAGAETLGRSLLASDNVVLVIPKAPLAPGKSYVVKVTSGGRTARSRFSITN